jgi:hypothetical protein
VANVEKTKSRNSSLGLLGLLFSPFFGLLGASRNFAALYVEGLKAYDSEGDNCDFPYKTRGPERLGYKSPLSL